MAASSPGYDLLTKSGWSNFRDCFKYKAQKWPSIKQVLRQTLAPIWCDVVGHDRYDAGIPPVGDGYEIACRRCQKFVTPPGSAY